MTSFEFIKENFPTTISKEFMDFFCGDFVGEGCGRIVYRHRFDHSLVVKIEYEPHSFQNVHEWDLWQQHHAANTSVCDFLAPCVEISHSGNILLQKYAKPVPFSFDLPKSIPAVLNCDCKRENWGIYQKRIVCRDYGRHLAVREASLGRNMARAEWREVENGRFRPLKGMAGATKLVI